MQSVIKIVRLGVNSGSFSYDTGLHTETETIIYSGKAAIGEVTGGNPMLLGDEDQFFSSVQVSIPITAALVIIDDIVEILSGPDPHVIGRTFRVTDVGGGGDIPVEQVINASGVARSRTNP